MRICVSRLEPVGSRAKPTAATWGIMSKTQLRQQLLKARDALPNASRAAASQQICDQLDTLLQPIQGAIGSYLAAGSEVDLDTLHQRFWRAGGTLYVPKIRSRTTMDFVELPSASDEITGAYGIRTSCLDDSIEVTNLNVLLIPCTGFSRAGHRLGMGGGFYDRLLEHSEPGRPRRIGVAFSVQEAEFEAEIWDQKFDLVITELGAISP